MTPTDPKEPQEDKVEEAGTPAEETTEAAKPKPRPKAGGEPRRAETGRAKKPAAADAAKAEGEATPEAAAKPKRAAKPKAEAEAKPKAATARAKKKDEAADAGPSAAQVEAEASEKAAESQPAAKKQPTSRSEKAVPATPAPTRRRRKDPEPTENGVVVVSAHAKYVRTSARKARLVCDHIRGKDVQEARAILAFTPRAASKAWMKLLESAVANAEHNHELVGEELRIDSVFADEGPTLKRFRPRAMGRATRIRKRTSHLTITLAPKQQSGAGREGK